MKAFIYTGGSICADRITEHPEAGDLVIAADSGYRNARLLGEQVSLLLGDMDSLGGDAAAAVDEVQVAGGEVLRVPAEKDETDTQLAVREAVMRGADELVIIGGMSGRVDHTLSNLAILEAMCERRIPTCLLDGRNRARCIKNDSLLLANVGFRYLSLIAVDEVCRGVSVEGCRYPLKNATLHRRNQYAVSNEMTGVAALVSVKRGRLLVIESSDG
ncbi:MAG: thiamine diphosphokinase [Clostridia bacterium]|nr:thiamine diphosphokinase [Clostridia bacterium]